MDWVDKAPAARKEFRRAVRAHIKAMDKAVATLRAVYAAEKGLYDAYVGISDEYRKLGITRGGDDVTFWNVGVRLEAQARERA